MTRLNQAWQALMGRLPEPEVRTVEKEAVVLGSPVEVTLYEVLRMNHRVYGLSYMETVARYHTCEQAHSEHPGTTIRAAKYWHIGDMYLGGLQVAHIEVQPKPKIAKGKRK